MRWRTECRFSVLEWNPTIETEMITRRSFPVPWVIKVTVFQKRTTTDTLYI
jgi:hypothetical protein